MNSKIAIAAATSALLLGSAAIAQTTTETTTSTEPMASTMGSAPNVSGDLNSQLTVAPAQGTALQPSTTQSTIASGSTRTTTSVTVQPKVAPAPVATGAGEMQAGERG